MISAISCSNSATMTRDAPKNKFCHTMIITASNIFLYFLLLQERLAPLSAASASASTSGGGLPFAHNAAAAAAVSAAAPRVTPTVVSSLSDFQGCHILVTL